jgi:hypothetical protein
VERARRLGAKQAESFLVGFGVRHGDEARTSVRRRGKTAATTLALRSRHSISYQLHGRLPTANRRMRVEFWRWS